MCESLIELDKDYSKKNGNLQFFKGDNMDVLKELHKKHKIANIDLMLITPHMPRKGMTLLKNGLKKKILLFILKRICC